MAKKKSTPLITELEMLRRRNNGVARMLMRSAQDERPFLNRKMNNWTYVE